jgi:hypothetical protein
MAIDNRENLHTLAAFRKADRFAAALRRGKCRINETFPLVDGPFVAQRIGQLHEDFAQHPLLTLLLKSPMDRFVVGIALRQELPLRARIQNPEHGLQDRSGRDRFAPGTAIGDVFFGKMLPNSVPVVIAQPQHARTYTGRTSGRQLF